MTKGTGTRTAAPDRLLTEVELELMSILWRLGSGSVRDVMAELPEERRGLAYTSVSTVLRILEQKGFVSSTPAGKTHRSVCSCFLPSSLNFATNTRAQHSSSDGAQQTSCHLPRGRQRSQPT